MPLAMLKLTAVAFVAVLGAGLALTFLAAILLILFVTIGSFSSSGLATAVRTPVGRRARRAGVLSVIGAGAAAGGATSVAIARFSDLAPNAGPAVAIGAIAGGVAGVLVWTVLTAATHPFLVFVEQNFNDGRSA